MQFLRNLPMLFLVAGLSTFHDNALAVDDIPTLTWELSTVYNNDGGCGFTKSYREASPENIADKVCADNKKHDDCFRAHGIAAHTDSPPSIFHDLIKPTATNPNYLYRFSCTNTDLIGYQVINTQVSEFESEQKPHQSPSSPASNRKVKVSNCNACIKKLFMVSSIADITESTEQPSCA